MGANMLAGDSISGPISKLVELPTGYAINGQMYDKINTAPVPQSFFIHKSSVACESILKEMSRVNSGWTGMSTKKSFIQDRKDPNIVYLVSNVEANMNNGTIPLFYKLKKNGARYSVMGKNAAISGGSKGSLDIIDDDDKYVYLSLRGNNSYFSIIRIDKETMAASELNVCPVGSSNIYPCVVYPIICNGFLYVVLTAAKNEMYKINLSSFTLVKYTQPTTNTVAGYQCMSLRKDGDILTGYYIGKPNELWVMKFDTVTNVVTDAKVCDIPVPLVVTTELTEICILQNKDYILITARNIHGVAGVAERDIVLFTVDGGGVVTYKGYLDAGFSYVNFLFSEADDLLYIANRFRFDVISITDARALKLAQSVTPSYLNTIGKDTNGNIYLVNEDTSIHLLNREIPIKLKCEFADSYEFDGTPIDSNMIISMETHLGTTVNGSVKIDLLGPVVFTDGTQTKEVSVSGITQVPIKVIGSGDLRYNIINI